NVGLISDFDSACGHGFKFWNEFIDNDCHTAWAPDVSWWKFVGLLSRMNAFDLKSRWVVWDGTIYNFNPNRRRVQMSPLSGRPAWGLQASISSATTTRRPSAARML